MIRAIIIDDEPRGVSVLQALLQTFCPQVEVIATCNDADTAKGKILMLNPDLIFLDIAMPDKSGLELLQELPSIEANIIFVTAYDHFMLDAFRYSAIDYLLKPVAEDQLIQAVQRSGQRMTLNLINNRIDTLSHNLKQQSLTQDHKLCLPSLKGFQVVSLNDIIYCEAHLSYTVFYLTGQSKVTVSRNLHEYEELLQHNGFLRIHKSYLINLNHVKEYQRGEGGTVTLSNNKEIEVSRRRREIFITRMKELYNF